MQLSEIRDQIRMVLPPEVSDVTDANLTLLVNQSLKEISVSSKWPFLHDSSTITTVADQQNYALPATFLYGIKLVDDDHDDELDYQSPSQFFEWYGNATQASTATTAATYTIYEGDILLHPTPSDADDARYTLYFYKEITELSADGDAPEFLDTFHWIPVEWVKWKLYEREGMSEQSQGAFVQYAQQLEQMRQWYTTPVAREPWVAGDGYRRRLGDPNLPILNFIQ